MEISSLKINQNLTKYFDTKISAPLSPEFLHLRLWLQTLWVPWLLQENNSYYRNIYQTQNFQPLQTQKETYQVEFFFPK